METREVKITETDLEIRRTTWRHIQEITTSGSLSDQEKLRLCLNEASIYAALTGDDSLFPQPIRDNHQAMSKWIKQNMEKIEKRRQAAERDAASGQPMFGE